MGSPQQFDSWLDGSPIILVGSTGGFTAWLDGSPIIELGTGPLTPQQGTLSFSGSAPILTNEGRTPNTGALSLTSDGPSLGRSLLPDSGTLTLSSDPPLVGINIPGTGLLTLSSDAPEAVISRMPGTAALSAIGAAPHLDLGILTPAGTLTASSSAPSTPIAFFVHPVTGALLLEGHEIVWPMWLLHYRTITRPMRFALVHERLIQSDAQRFSLQHSRQVIRTVGWSLVHSREILPGAVFPLFDEDIQMPTALVDKT